MSDKYTRARLLDDFCVEAAKRFGQSPLGPGDIAFLSTLTQMVPGEGFVCQTPPNVVVLVGDIEEETAISFYGEAMDAHSILPIETPIEIHLSSDGGDATAGYSICSTILEIRRQGRKVNCHVSGVAFSMAFYILQSCDYRSAEYTSMLMAHHEQFGIEGSATTHKNESDSSMAHTKSMLEIICRRTGRPIDYYLKKLTTGEWYTMATEAFKEGLLDEVKPKPEYEPSPFKPTPRAPRKKKEGLATKDSPPQEEGTV